MDHERNISVHTTSYNEPAKVEYREESLSMPPLKPKVALFFHPEQAFSREEQSELAEILGDYFDVKYKSGTLLSPEVFISISLGVMAGTAMIALHALIGQITEDLYKASKRFLKKNKPNTWKLNVEIDGVGFTGEVRTQSWEKLPDAFKNLRQLFYYAERVALDRQLPTGVRIEEIKKDVSTPTRVLTSEDKLEELQWVTFNYRTAKGNWELKSVGAADGYFVEPGEAREYRKCWGLLEYGRANAKTTITQAPGANTQPTSAFKILVLTSPTQRNTNATVEIQTLAGANCFLSYKTPAGKDSGAIGLGAKTADANGKCSWTWGIGPRTKPGNGILAIKTNGNGQLFDIVIQ